MSVSPGPAAGVETSMEAKSPSPAGPSGSVHLQQPSSVESRPPTKSLQVISVFFLRSRPVGVMVTVPKGSCLQQLLLLFQRCLSSGFTRQIP